MPDAREPRRASFTDPVANAVLVPNVRLQDVAQVFARRGYSPESLPSFIHEATHFESFATPVGQALATLCLRAWRRVILDDQYEAVVDLVRYRSAMAGLEPLFEGTALFAEYDWYPLSSPVTTIPTVLCAMLFNAVDAFDDESKTVGDVAAETLVRARRSSLFTTRKENLLARPFGSAWGGYGLGYYFVKNLRYFLFRKPGCDRLIDGDLFLQCIRAKVLGDYRLARLIVDPELDLMLSASPEAVQRDAVNAVLVRLQELLTELFREIDAEYIDKVEGKLGGEEPWLWFDVQPSRDDQGYRDWKVLKDAIASLSARARHSSEVDRRLESIIDFASRRHSLLCVGSVEAPVLVNKHGICSVGEPPNAKDREPQPWLSVAAMPGTERCSGRGTIEIYLDAFGGNHLYYRIDLDQNLVAAGTPSGPGEQSVYNMFRETAPVNAVAEVRAEMEEDLQRIYADKTWSRIVGHYVNDLSNLVDRIYLKYVDMMLEDWPGGRFDRRLLDSGLLPLVDSEDLKFLQHYAVVSLAPCLQLNGADLNQYGASLQVDVNALRAWSRRWNSEKNFPLTTELGPMTVFHL